MKRLRIFTLCLMLAAPAAAQESPDARAQKAQENLSRGVAMAQQQQWSLALKYFRAAHQLQPTDPATLFNLGLANDRAGGRELAAIAWYNGFLALSPDARNAAQVRKRLTEIEIAVESQTQKLLETAQAATGQVPSGQDVSEAYARLARAQAEAGDAGAAQRALDRVSRPQAKAWPTAIIAASHARSGRIDIADTMVKGLAAGRPKAWALAELSAAQATARNFTAARASADAISVAPEKAWALARIAALQARAGDLAGAIAAWESIPAEQAGQRAAAAAAIAAASKDAGKWWGESETALAAIKDFRERSEAVVLMARFRAEAGDLAEAERLAASLPDDEAAHRARKLIAQGRGDLALAETYRWMALALKAEADGPGDIDTLVRNAQAATPTATAAAIAAAAEKRARFLQAFRRTD